MGLARGIIYLAIIGCVCAVGAWFYQPTLLQKPIQVVQDVNAHVKSQKIKPHRVAAPSQRGNTKQTKPSSEGGDPHALQELVVLSQKIKSKDVLDGRALKELREPAMRLLQYDPTAFESHLLGEVRTAKDLKAATFLVDVYVENHDSPGEVIHKILNAKNQDPDLLAQIQAFTIESLSLRVGSGEDFVSDPLPQVKSDLETIAKEGQSLALVKEALWALRDQYEYPKTQLEALIAHRKDRDVFLDSL